MQPDCAETTTHTHDDSHWRLAGERIQNLLDCCAADGPKARERAEDVVHEVVELYGNALTRVMQIVKNSPVVDQLIVDDLIASLLLVHGVHPHDMTDRVKHALDTVRPYLGSHGGDVHLTDIIDGVVRLEFSGSCQSCPSSAVTLELAVHDAIKAAAPEITTIEVVNTTTATNNNQDKTVIPVESLLSRVHTQQKSSYWHPTPELAMLLPGEIAGFTVDGIAVFGCRIDDNILVYRDHCPHCANSLAGAQLSIDSISCPHCHSRYDAGHAGIGITNTTDHLDPVPTLTRDGVLCMAFPTDSIGVSR